MCFLFMWFLVMVLCRIWKLEVKWLLHKQSQVVVYIMLYMDSDIVFFFF